LSRLRIFCWDLILILLFEDIVSCICWETWEERYGWDFDVSVAIEAWRRGENGIFEVDLCVILIGGEKVACGVFRPMKRTAWSVRLSWICSIVGQMPKWIRMRFFDGLVLVLVLFLFG